MLYYCLEIEAQRNPIKQTMQLPDFPSIFILAALAYKIVLVTFLKTDIDAILLFS